MLKRYDGFFPRSVWQGIILAAFVGAVILSGSPEHERLASLSVSGLDRDRFFEGEVVEGMTILDALKASMRAGDIELQFNTDETGHITTITRINGLDNLDQDEIYVFVNDKRIDASRVAETPLRPGDDVVIKFAHE